MSLAALVADLERQLEEEIARGISPARQQALLGIISDFRYIEQFGVNPPGRPNSGQPLDDFWLSQIAGHAASRFDLGSGGAGVIGAINIGAIGSIPVVGGGPSGIQRTTVEELEALQPGGPGQGAVPPPTTPLAPTGTPVVPPGTPVVPPSVPPPPSFVSPTLPGPSALPKFEPTITPSLAQLFSSARARQVTLARPMTSLLDTVRGRRRPRAPAQRFFNLLAGRNQ